MDKRISRLHCITWDDAGRDALEQVNLLVEAGADWIQLRQKSGTYGQKLAVAQAAVQICKPVGVVLIINDDVRLCEECGADGVHLGLNDMPIAQARAQLGEQAIIGGTANTPAQAIQRFRDGADYVGLGPWRYTGTKENLSPVLGEDGVRAALDALLQAHCLGPVVVIGGILPHDVSSIVGLGAHGVAVSSAVVAASNVDMAFTDFYMALHAQGR